MTGDDAQTLGDGDLGGKMPFDTSVAHQARMYDYVLGRKVKVVQTRA